MEFALIALVVVLLVAAYFFLGVLLKFILGWWILVLGIPALIMIAFTQGWVGAATAFIGFFVLLYTNNHWQGTSIYVALERVIDRIFSLADV